MSRLIAPLMLALLLSASSPVTAGPVAECGRPDVNMEGAIVVGGEGKLNSRPFDLDAAAYTVRWSGSAPTKIAPGNLIVMLKRTDGPHPQELLVNAVMSKGDPDMSGETQVYLTKAGAHYLDVMAPASWTVTIARQS